MILPWFDNGMHLKDEYSLPLGVGDTVCCDNGRNAVIDWVLVRIAYEVSGAPMVAQYCAYDEDGGRYTIIHKI